MRDTQTRTDNTIEHKHKEVMAEVESLKSRVTALEEIANALKKQLAMLDDKMRGMIKGAAMSGNPGAAGNLLEDFEKAIEELRKDLNDHKGQNAREHDEFRQMLMAKASKDDLTELEERMM